MKMSVGFHTQYVLLACPKKRVPHHAGSDLLPDGCEWSRTCTACPFDDCRAGQRILGYDHPKAALVRAGKSARTVPAPNPVRIAAVAQRVAGISEVVVARHFNVHPRTIRHWCEGVEGIDRGQGNRHRHG